MPDASQPTPEYNLASKGPQAALVADSQPEQTKSSSSDNGIRAIFKAAAQLAAKMTPEEIQNKNSWGMSLLGFYVYRTSTWPCWLTRASHSSAAE